MANSSPRLLTAHGKTILSACCCIFLGQLREATRHKRPWHSHLQHRPLLNPRNSLAQYDKLHNSVGLLVARSRGLRPGMDRLRKATPPSQAHPRTLLGIDLAALDRPPCPERRHGHRPARTASKVRSTRPHWPGRDRVRRPRGHKQDLSDVEAFGEATRLLQRLAEQVLFEIPRQLQQHQ
jgi:hypothetical protein